MRHIPTRKQFINRHSAEHKPPFPRVLIKHCPSFGRTEHATMPLIFECGAIAQGHPRIRMGGSESYASYIKVEIAHLFLPVCYLRLNCYSSMNLSRLMLYFFVFVSMSCSFQELRLSTPLSSCHATA